VYARLENVSIVSSVNIPDIRSWVATPVLVDRQQQQIQSKQPLPSGFLAHALSEGQMAATGHVVPLQSGQPEQKQQTTSQSTPVVVGLSTPSFPGLPSQLSFVSSSSFNDSEDEFVDAEQYDGGDFDAVPASLSANFLPLPPSNNNNNDNNPNHIASLQTHMILLPPHLLNEYQLAVSRFFVQCAALYDLKDDDEDIMAKVDVESLFSPSTSLSASVKTSISSHPSSVSSSATTNGTAEQLLLVQFVLHCWVQQLLQTKSKSKSVQCSKSLALHSLVC
jgi:hypothetical protein